MGTCCASLSVCPSVPCLRFCRNKKTVENYIPIQWTIVTIGEQVKKELNCENMSGSKMKYAEQVPPDDVMQSQSLQQYTKSCDAS